jgi:sirohydrochlorin cobaltochelatase
MRDLAQPLLSWLENGGREVGEVNIVRAGSGFELRHRDDAGLDGLVESTGPNAARDISNFDAAGKFRPLKTAPNLRRGWKLRLASAGELSRALDYLYPAMVGVWTSHTRGELQPVTLRETLSRQTGMYRVTQKLTDDDAQTLIGAFCQSETGCLKHLLWKIAPEVPVQTLPAAKLQPAPAGAALPLLCHEACNLLVAQARTVVKKAEKPA